MLRSVIKNVAAQAVCVTRLDALAHARLHRDIPFVTAYHRVVERAGACGPLALPAMEITTAMLERHLDWLGRHFRIVSLSELEPRRGSKPTAAITFDDGYSDVFHHAFPMLKRKGIPAGIFVVTDLVGTKNLPIHERLHAALVRPSSALRAPSPRTRGGQQNLLPLAARSGERGEGPQNLLPLAPRSGERVAEGRVRGVPQDPFTLTQHLLATRTYAEVEEIIAELGESANGLTDALRPMTWEMLAAMRDAGMTIGSHSRTHAFLGNEAAARLGDETEESRRQLEAKLGTQIEHFAYPGGSFTSRVVDAVAAAGYRFGFTICRHRDSRYPLLTIPRTGLWQQSCLDPSGRFSKAIMSSQAAGAFRLMSRCTQRHKEH